MKYDLYSLTALRGILGDEVFSAFADCSCKNPESFPEFVGKFYNRKKFPDAGYDLYAYTFELIAHDENALAVALAGGKPPESFLERAYKRDLEIIFGAVKACDPRGFFACNARHSSADEIYAELAKIFSERGFGRFMDSYALSYTNGQIISSGAVAPPSSPESLKNYSEEKRVFDDNLINFIKGLPYSHTLLYGDRGTGKSSTVHALVHSHFKEGLRLIELPPEQAAELEKLRAQLAGLPLKFVILIDDIGVDGIDEKISALKSAIEGGASLSDNTMIAATSNRRHIVREKQSDRQDSLHENEVIQEQLSLSDRFGLTIAFPSADKEQYLSIVKQLADDYKLKMPEDRLMALAEKWALKKGGRSPRRAKQFADFLLAAQVRGLDPDL